MAAHLIEQQGNEVTIQIKVNLSGTMLEAEERIQDACNQAGMLATAESLKRFDTDGSPIITGEIKWTDHGTAPRKYQTPYGEVEVLRHTYQTSKGGCTYCPLDASARIIRQQFQI